MDDAELKALMDSGPHDPETRRRMGRALLDRKRWKMARQILDAAVRVSPTDVKARALLARASLHDGDPEAAARLIAGLPKASRRNRTVWRLRIVALERSGESDKAEVQAKIFTSKHGKDNAVQAVLDRIASRKNHLPEHLAAPDPHVSVRRARAYAQRGDLERAVRTLRRVHFHQDDKSVEALLDKWEHRLSLRRRAALTGDSLVG